MKMLINEKLNLYAKVVLGSENLRLEENGKYAGTLSPVVMEKDGREVLSMNYEKAARNTYFLLTEERKAILEEVLAAKEEREEEIVNDIVKAVMEDKAQVVEIENASSVSSTIYYERLDDLRSAQEFINRAIEVLEDMTFELAEERYNKDNHDTVRVYKFVSEEVEEVEEVEEEVKESEEVKDLLDLEELALSVSAEDFEDMTGLPRWEYNYFREL